MSVMKRWILLPLLAVTCLAGTGCELDNDDKDADRKRTRRDRYRDRDDRVIGRDPDRVRDRDLDVDVDVDRDRDRDRVRERDRDRDRSLERRSMDTLPPRAIRLQQTEARQEATYTAERNGRIYVFDVNEDAIIYSSRLFAGERFVLDPDDNLATIDGRTVLDRDLKSDHRFRLYFALD